MILPVGFLALAVAQLCPEKDCKIYRLAGRFFDCDQNARTTDEKWLNKEIDEDDSSIPECVKYKGQSSEFKCPENCLYWRNHCIDYKCDPKTQEAQKIQKLANILGTRNCIDDHRCLTESDIWE
jgi:hypothetical protein